VPGRRDLRRAARSGSSLSAAAHEPGRPLVAAGGAGSPAALENVRLVAIDPSEDGDIEEVSLRLD